MCALLWHTEDQANIRYQLLWPTAGSKRAERRENSHEMERDSNISLDFLHIVSVSGLLQDSSDERKRKKTLMAA